MKGATAEPCEKTMRAPSNTSIITIGISHHFLRTLRKSQNSAKIDNLDIKQLPPAYYKFIYLLLFIREPMLVKIGFHNQPFQIL